MKILCNLKTALFDIACSKLEHLRLISITAARCVAWREKIWKHYRRLYISRHATQRAAVMETGL